MKTKQFFMACMMSASFALPAAAQDYYDITGLYLQNAGFDSDFDYSVSATGNVAQEILDVKGWTKDISVNYTITGVYQFGTKVTFNNALVPAVGYDGTAEGGCLALSTGWTQSMLFNQSVALPAGKYAIVTAYYNCGDKTVGTSKVGWLPAGKTAVLSKVSSYECGVWKTDTVRFELTKSTSGKIQIGYTAGGKGSSESAKIVFDYIKLLRDTPVGKVDVDAVKEQLTPVIDEALALYGEGNGNEAAALKAAIDEAQALLANDEATIEMVKEGIGKLEAAVDAYLWANPTGAVPTVTTDPRYARGSVVAYGRMTSQGTDIIERGFCWSETPEPTIFDQKTTRYLENNGKIYILEDLKPATLYYMRAYAVTKGRQVGYGDVVKFYTIPKGQIGYTIRSGGDAAVVQRITEAVKGAVDCWNNLTSIKGFSTSVGYESGVPTADCSYGGWIRVGSNVSYQRTGTILHELLHGGGVIPWADTEWSRHNLRASVNGDGKGTGAWLGDRVTQLLRFWDNSTTAQLNGDYQHMWPYGINGAQEDNGTELLYTGNGLVCQALGEDGLQHTSGSYAQPCYTLDIDESKKYYLKNEWEEGGLYSSYLVVNNAGQLVWATMTAEQAAANDSAAWTITFTPANQYYQFKNVATGRYMSYSKTGVNGIATAQNTVPGSSENFHLMRSRMDIKMGGTTVNKRGYWMIHPESNWTPKCLAANNNGTTSAMSFNIANSSSRQRWLILEESEMAELEKASVNGMIGELEKALDKLKGLTDVPHTEDEPGVDDAVETVNQHVADALTSSVTSPDVLALMDEVQTATANFLRGATPAFADQPFDVTYAISNPGMDNAEGWSVAPAISYSCGEFYQTTFDMNQTLKDMPAGTYRFSAKGFQRPGSSATAYADYVAGKNNVNAYIYAGSDKVKLAHIATEARDSKLGGSESAVGTPVKYMPNNMEAASIYFAKGLYDNSAVTTLATDGASLKVGISCSSMPSSYWCIFDDFRLYFYGSISKDIVTDIKQIAGEQQKTVHDIYTLDGRLVRRHATTMEGLEKGIYIIGKKKVVVR